MVWIGAEMLRIWLNGDNMEIKKAEFHEFSLSGIISFVFNLPLL